MAVDTVPSAAAKPAPAVHPLITRLCAETGGTMLDLETFDAWAQAAGRALVVFTEDPQLYPETLDLAVVAPELARAFAVDGKVPFRVGVLLQAAGRTIARRYGFKRWPALVMLLDGQYVGAVDGLRDWQDYLGALGELLAAAPSRPPSIGIAVNAADSDPSHHCH